MYFMKEQYALSILSFLIFLIAHKYLANSDRYYVYAFCTYIDGHWAHWVRAQRIEMIYLISIQSICLSTLITISSVF